MEELKKEVDNAVAVLKKGGIILYPTDTVWGIGCDASNREAVEKIYALKRSANKNSMIVLAGTVDMASRYASKAPSIAWELMEMADKPLTLILPGAASVAENVIPEDGTIGIRVPVNDFCNRMLRRFGRAVVSTSANISGEATPLTFGEITGEIKDGVDYIVNPAVAAAGTGKSSSIIKVGEGGEIEIIRP